MKGRVLVFGGSGFVGRATVKRLLEAGYAVVMANRQQAHWGDANPSRVAVLQCNRQKRAQVEAAVRAHDDWTAIVDFTSFQAADVAPILEVYAERRELPQQEEDFAVFPEDLELRERLSAEDDYGAGKLLVEQHLSARFPTLALRLPDVYGPYDESRFWKYFLWLSVADQFPVFLKTKRECCFVFSGDVARAIVLALDASPRPRASVNVATLRTTLQEFLALFARCAGFKHAIKFTWEESEEGFCEEFLPSVDYNVSTAKLPSVLPLFVSTPVEEAMREMAAFYKRAWDRHPAERQEVLAELPRAWHSAIRRRAIALADE